MPAATTTGPQPTHDPTIGRVSDASPETVTGAGGLAAEWDRVLEALAGDPEVSRASFATWLKGTRLLARDGDRFTVVAQHRFAREKLERSYAAVVGRVLQHVTGCSTAHVRFVVPGQREVAGDEPRRPAERPEDAARRDTAPLTGQRPVAGEAAVPEVESAPVETGTPPSRRGEEPATAPAGQRPAGAPLSARFTFAAFVSGRETQFAYAAARAVAENPVLAYNPLFVCGGPGLGKTHLLHAIAQRAMAVRPGLGVVYTTARTLLADLGAAAGIGARGAALARYTADVLLLDDVDDLAHHPRQKDVFHLLDAAVASDRQVVLTAGGAPRALEGIDERLRSLFQMGLVADLGAPEHESRVALVRAKAEARGVALGAAAIDLIARRAGPSVRELEGALTRVVAAAELGHAPLTLEGVAATLAGTASAGAASRGRPALPHVRDAVAHVFGVPVAALLARRRDKEIALPRQVAMYLMREETGASLSEIGAALGGRDHSTVLHGYEKIAGALARDAHLCEQVETARRLIAHAPAAPDEVGKGAAAH